MFNKATEVDLTNIFAEPIHIEYDLLKKYLGSNGPGAKLFTDRVKPDVNPLSPENTLVFTIGTVTGVAISTSGRIKITQANYWCNRLGVDTISMGVTISCAMELQEKWLLPYNNFKFGNEDILIDAVKKTAFVEGIGSELAGGSKILAEKYGDPQTAIHEKELEIPAYDPRGAFGHALGYATSNRGGYQLTGYMAAMELFSAPKRIPRFTQTGKPDLFALKQNQSAVEDGRICCKFLGYAAGLGFHARFLTAITGLEFNVATLTKIGERSYNLERPFNIAAGVIDYTLPERVINEPFKEGISKDSVIPKKGMLSQYYFVRGWDERGVPGKHKLDELEIDWKQ
ncbi:MAG TPA: aldehyde ferredoxin oxidoreductase C-terminal domain-containing protein [Bacteroidales bacterium]|nr:aldehyde ferredoxin oxidoreductase C-terminal domain-containing protein [Bacteroidales bacterium]